MKYQRQSKRNYESVRKVEGRRKCGTSCYHNMRSEEHVKEPVNFSRFGRVEGLVEDAAEEGPRCFIVVALSQAQSNLRQSILFIIVINLIITLLVLNSDPVEFTFISACSV